MSQRIDAIDGLRAIAMTVVVLQHCALMPFGWMGVWVFYVISGFVVCNSFHNRLVRSPEDAAGAVRHFMFRRITRIWPVYLAYVAITLLGVSLAGGEFDPLILLALVGFMYNWNRVFEFAGEDLSWRGLDHLWTISVEQQFYILFPLFYFLFIHQRTDWRGGLALILMSPVIRYLLGYLWTDSGAPQEQAFDLVYFSSIGHLDAFMIGALLSRHREKILATTWAETALWTLAIGVSSAYVATQLGINYFIHGLSGRALVGDIVAGNLYGNLKEVFVYYIPVLTGTALMLSILKNSAFVRPLAFAPLRWIGEVSYGAYVFHFGIIELVVHLVIGDYFESLPVIQRIGYFVIVYAVTLAISKISFEYFEKWFSRLKLTPRSTAQPNSPS